MNKKGGPKPTPNALKIAKGTYRKNQDKGELPLEPIALYQPHPSRFGEYAKGCWETLFPKLMSNRVMSETDLFQFENLCFVYGEWRKCCDQVDIEGMTYVSDKGNTMPNPIVHIASAYFKNYNQIASRFGLTPSDRVGLPNTIAQKVDPLEALMQKANGA